MKEFDLNNIVSLLDDPDAEVYKLIAEDIMSQGVKVIPALEKVWYQTASSTVQQRIEDILHEMQEKEALQGFTEWVNNGSADILEGAYWIAKFQYPDLQFSKIYSVIRSILRMISK